jgi:pyruvate, water dikinase
VIATAPESKAAASVIPAPVDSTAWNRPDLVRPFASIGLADIALVGGKNASLGEMIVALAASGVPVPDGFAVTAAAYRLVLERAGLVPQLSKLLDGLDPGDVASLAWRAAEARRLVAGAELPAELREAIVAAYRELGRASSEQTTNVAVRSSATAEDLPEASFAGQQETYLNVRGEAELLSACRRCFASLFTDRAMAYRAHHGYDHLTVGLSVGVQRMVRSDLGAAGVLFTLDTDTGFRDVVLINAAYGLGETVVRGTVNPDEFCVFKPTLKPGRRPILERRLGSKETKLVYDSRGGMQGTRVVPVPAGDRARFAISDDEVLQLARWGVLIEEHYSRRAGRWVPMDIEWAKDGRTGQLFVLQARPETVHSRRDHTTLEVHRLVAPPAPLLSGQAVGSSVGAGIVRVVHQAAGLVDVAQGDVLVAEMTDPDWVPALRKVSALVTERGGRTCHAAIVSRELGIPAVVGTAGALTRLTAGEEVTVSCAEGSTGHVYQGRVPVDVERTALTELPRPRTRILLNIADPDRAFALSFLPVDGVGLARMEFIIGNSIGIHPMALVRYPNAGDPHEVEQIARRTAGYADKREYFVDRLAQGIGKIAAAFYPREVVVRLADFKTNEYAGLLGGSKIEPREENPMLGFRGAARYVHPLYREGFALECAAIRRVRGEMGLTNVKLMVPFCRTPEEGRRVLDVLAEEGLRRGEDGLEILVMCEIPSNVLLAADFAALFDGFSIGSNDLTQLVLGVDRDSPLVAPSFDERNPAVKEMLERTIEAAHAAGRKVGICGQAPSDYPELAAFLVEHGIDSLSLNADAVITTLRTVAAAEDAMSANLAR